MAKKTNSHIIDAVKEITVARMENTTMTPNADGGKNVADYMQAIYDKLVELNDKEN